MLIGHPSVTQYCINSTENFQLWYYGGDLILGQNYPDGSLLLFSQNDQATIDRQAQLNNASGLVFCTGLGVGAMLQILANNPLVSSITVLEKHQEIVDLLQPYIPSCEIIIGDADTFIPTQNYDVIWLDHWITQTPEEIAQFAITKTRLSNYLTNGGWIGEG